MTRAVDDLIFDWNLESPPPKPPVVQLNDETLRDGLQSPSVRAPTINQKLRILHLLDRIGIDTAAIGLPGAGPHVVRDVERLASEIVECRLKVQANCVARTVIADIQPIADIVQRTGLPIECGCFIGSSPIRQYTEDWTVDYLQRCTEEAIAFGVPSGPENDVRHRRHHAIGPGHAAAAVPDRNQRRRAPVVHRRHRRSCDAGRRARGRAVCRAGRQDSGAQVGIDWHGHRDRDLGTINSLAALEAGASRVHGTMLGIGERVGNTPMDLLMVNLVLMGWIERDLTHLNDLVQAVSDATGEPIPDNYPVFGRDAFRTATGVHAAAVVKAFHKNDSELADTVYRACRREWLADCNRSKSARCGARTSSSGSSTGASPPTTNWSIASSAAPRDRQRCSPSRRSCGSSAREQS